MKWSLLSLLYFILMFLNHLTSYLGDNTTSWVCFKWIFLFILKKNFSSLFEFNRAYIIYIWKKVTTKYKEHKKMLSWNECIHISISPCQETDKYFFIHFIPMKVNIRFLIESNLFFLFFTFCHRSLHLVSFSFFVHPLVFYFIFFFCRSQAKKNFT